MPDNDDHKPDRAAEPDKTPNEQAPRKTDNDDPANRQSEISKRLDQGLEETFPSSDPVSVKITK